MQPRGSDTAMLAPYDFELVGRKGVQAREVAFGLRPSLQESLLVDVDLHRLSGVRRLQQKKIRRRSTLTSTHGLRRVEK